MSARVDDSDRAESPMEASMGPAHLGAGFSEGMVLLVVDMMLNDPPKGRKQQVTR